jgi:membrane-bound ClpP family serine protease
LLVVAAWIGAVAMVFAFFCVGVGPTGRKGMAMLLLTVLGSHEEDLSCRLETST